MHFARPVYGSALTTNARLPTQERTKMNSKTINFAQSDDVGGTDAEVDGKNVYSKRMTE